MFNDWLTIGPITIHGYGVMIGIGVLFAFWLAEKLAVKYSLEKDKIDSFVFACLAGGYLCSKITYCLINFQQFMKDPLSVLGTGGWVVYGGIVGGVFSAFIYARMNHWDFMKYFNALVPCVALAQGFGRIGCFFAGCCYGVQTDSVIGVSFPVGSLAPSGVKLVPTQLLSSLGDFLVFFVLMWNMRKEERMKDNASLYLMLYSAGRFAIEFFRGDVERGNIGPFSTSQFIAIFVFLFGAWLIHRRQRKEEASAI